MQLKRCFLFLTILSLLVEPSDALAVFRDDWAKQHQLAIERNTSQIARLQRQKESTEVEIASLHEQKKENAEKIDLLKTRILNLQKQLPEVKTLPQKRLIERQIHESKDELLKIEADETPLISAIKNLETQAAGATNEINNLRFEVLLRQEYPSMTPLFFNALSKAQTQKLNILEIQKRLSELSEEAVLSINEISVYDNGLTDDHIPANQRRTIAEAQESLLENFFEALLIMDLNEEETLEKQLGRRVIINAIAGTGTALAVAVTAPVNLGTATLIGIITWYGNIVAQSALHRNSKKARAMADIYNVLINPHGLVFSSRFAPYDRNRRHLQLLEKYYLTKKMRKTLRSNRTIEENIVALLTRVGINPTDIVPFPPAAKEARPSSHSKNCKDIIGRLQDVVSEIAKKK